ncbi:MAG: ribokinase [Chloroflexi bacterium]|nr:ribokinase [Chloroflexota bacterium]
MPPQFLAVGHVTRDLAPRGSRLGGTAAYGATTASRLGLQAAVVTAVSTDVDVVAGLPGVTIHVAPSRQTTTFQNTYLKGGREQRLVALADPITPQDVPLAWRGCPAVLLGPVAREVDEALAALFPGSFLGVTPQGWLRQWDASGRVTAAPWPMAQAVLSRASLAVVAEDDLPDPDVAEMWAAWVPLLVITRGRRGALLHWKGGWHSVPAFPAREVDPTGAGDVFAAAMLVCCSQGAEPLEAALFASCAASLSVAGVGLGGIPDLAAVEARLCESRQRERKDS